MEIKVYHTGNSFEDLIAKYLIVLDNNNIIFKGRVVKLLFKCGIEEFGAKTYELFIKNQKFI